MEKINIMHLRQGRNIYGAERVILNLANETDKNKFNVTICSLEESPNENKDFNNLAEKLNLNTINFKMNGKVNPLSIFRLSKLIRENKIDILHTHGYKPDIMGALSSLFCNVKLISTNHLWFTVSSKMKFYVWLNKLCLKRFDKIVAVSEKIFLQLRGCGLRKSKLFEIINGIPINKIKKRKTNKKIKKIAVIGRLTKQKGHKYLIKALEILKQEKIICLFIGNGGLETDLKNRVKKAGLDKKILFKGFSRNIQKIMDDIDIFVLPSLEEGTPMALLEAMAAKVPVIATSVGGVPNVIKNKENGLLVPSKNPETIASAIKYLLKNPQKAEKMAEQAYKTIKERFSAERMAREYEGIYEKLIS